MTNKVEMEKEEIQRGRGHSKIVQTGVKRKVTYNKGTMIFRLPVCLFRVGVALNREIMLQVVEGENPMNWELRIKPIVKNENTS